MYVAPVGTNPPSDEDRQPIVRYVSGDTLNITTRLALIDGTAATPTNSRVSVYLAETRFDENADALWSGSWNDGIVEVGGAGNSGLVRVEVPDHIADALKRGSYALAVTVSDRFGRQVHTPLRATILVEYEPGSPEHEIPYRS